jgi:hypothetical protein
MMRALALFPLTAAIARAQFKSTAALVIAPTTVTDSKGRYIDALAIPSGPPARAPGYWAMP